MHVAAVQLDIVWENKPANQGRIETMLDAADLPAGAYVVLPEMADTGFSFDLGVHDDDSTCRWAASLARRHQVWVQVGWARRGADGRGRNCMTIIDPAGVEVGTYEKVHPFSFGREAEFFSGGDELLVADVDGVAVCPVICYDLRFPELWRAATAARVDTAAEVFALGANWPDARQLHWRALTIARAIENQAYVVAVNRVGSDPHLGYAGGSLIVAPSGKILAEADATPQVLQADLDLAALRRWRETFPALRDARPALLGALPPAATRPRDHAS